MSVIRIKIRCQSYTLFIKHKQLTSEHYFFLTYNRLLDTEILLLTLHFLEHLTTLGFCHYGGGGVRVRDP